MEGVKSLGTKCTKLHDSKCNGGIEAALDIIVGKWKPIILYHLLVNEKLRFSELQRAIPGITKKMLTSQLRELEYHDIVHREVYPQVPPKVEYSITTYGKTMGPALMQMQQWGTQHIQHMIEAEKPIQFQMKKSE